MAKDKKNIDKNKDNSAKVNDKCSQDNQTKDTVQSVTEKLLRVNSDFQNFKRRAEKEKSEWFDIAQASVIKSFLPILDDFERAFDSFAQIDQKEDNKDWVKGFQLVFDKYKKTMKDLGVTEIENMKVFDPVFHEALMQVESEKHKTGEIVQVLNKGYTFKDKVIRHAKVSVAK